MSERQEEQAVAVAAALADGEAAAREAVYVQLEGAAKAQAIALLAGCVRPLIAEVLCAPASKVDAQEYRRAALLLYKMTAEAEMMAIVGAEAHRHDEQGVPLAFHMLSAPDTAFALAIAKDPSEWTRDDAITCALNFAHHPAMWAIGISPVVAAAGGDEVEWFNALMPRCPYHNNPQPADRYTQLCLILLDLGRSFTDEQLEEEGIIVGAAGLMNWITVMPVDHGSAAVALWEAGFLDVLQSAMQKYTPMERISKHIQIPGEFTSNLQLLEISGPFLTNCL